MQRKAYEATAHVYDLVYELQGKDYDSEAAALIELVEQYQPAAKTLLDVACGTGMHLAALRHRFDVAGVDIEPAMLDIARTRLPGVDLLQADMREMALGRSFDVVTCLFSASGYTSGPDELRASVEKMADHLTPGGVLVVDGWIRPDQWIEPGTVHVISGKKDGVGVARVGRSERIGKQTVLDLHYVVATLDGIEHTEERHEMTLFEDDEYLDAMRVSGLDTHVVQAPYGDRGRFVGVRPA